MSRTKWRCFHCGEVFTRIRLAREHFGAAMDDLPACRIAAHEGHLVTYIRKLEDELTVYRSESNDILLAIRTLEGEQRRALERAEEDGYAKGLRDAVTPVGRTHVGNMARERS